MQFSSLIHLQTTRIAKTVNELRRKTSDEALKRRAKNLLKRWREAVIPGTKASTPAATPITAATTTPNAATTHRLNQNGTVGHPASAVGQNHHKQHQRMMSSHPSSNQQQQQQQQQKIVPHKSSSLSSSLFNHGSNSSNKISPRKSAALSKENNQLHPQQSLLHDVGKNKGQFFNSIINNNNNSNSSSLRTSANQVLPSSSANHHHPTNVSRLSVGEIINVSDDESSSHPTFQSIKSINNSGGGGGSNSGNKRHRAMSPGAMPASNTNVNAIGLGDRAVEQTTSAKSVSKTNPSLFSGMLQLETSTCDSKDSFMIEHTNSSSATSRTKHKKHKRDKKLKSSSASVTFPAEVSLYNHHSQPQSSHLQSQQFASQSHLQLNQIDERSAPNMATIVDDSLSFGGSTGGGAGAYGMYGVGGGGGGGSSLPNNLILPDNDSLSNTSASLFNCTGTNSHLGGAKNVLSIQPLTFAGHFTKATATNTPIMETPTKVDQIASIASEGSPYSLPPTLSGPFTIEPDEQPVQTQSPQPPPPLLVEAKQPKKRGRKKGSKGIDSLLATQNEGAFTSLLNPDSYLDLKQKITSISAGNKKTRTTKELLADIQQKRSNSGTVSAVTSPSVTQAPSPASSSGKLIFICKSMLFLTSFFFSRCWLSTSFARTSTSLIGGRKTFKWQLRCN